MQAGKVKGNAGREGEEKCRQGRPAGKATGNAGRKGQ